MSRKVNDLAFAKDFKAARTRAGLSQEAAGHALNTTKTTVQNWESGRNLPSYPSIKRAILLFGLEFITPDDDEGTGTDRSRWSAHLDPDQHPSAA